MDGEYYYRSIYVPDVGPDGGVRGFYAMMFDITDLTTGRMRLAASEARLRLITDNLPVFISYIDRERRFRFNNATYAQWLGKPLEEITGQRVEDVTDPQSYALIWPNLDAAFTGVSASCWTRRASTSAKAGCPTSPPIRIGEPFWPGSPTPCVSRRRGS